MSYTNLIVLLPCHSLEDFPHHHEGEDADSLLACWTALWHPRLIAASHSAPQWFRMDDPPDDLQGSLVLVPTVSHQDLPTGFLKRASEADAYVIKRPVSRQEILDKALQKLPDPASSIPSDLVADFLALGYGFLQIQLLTRQMRYSSNLDEAHFNTQLVEGAVAACEGNQEEAADKIRICFDLLAEERDHYYSVDAYLVDLTMVAPTTLGASLEHELDGPVPSNLLISGGILEQIQREHPQLYARLAAQNTAGQLSLVGGEFDELENSLLASESILANLERGMRSYAACLGQDLEIFGRWRFGMTHLLPQLLHKHGFKGSVHLALDAGRTPEGSQSKTRWEGCDGSTLDAIAKAPLNAAQPDTFLALAQRLGESMDMDHVATLCFAHWPGQSCVWYEDLKRCARFNACLGKFVTLEEYFRDTYMPGHLDRFEPDQYRSPYLKQDVIRQKPDPISRWVRYWQDQALTESRQALRVMRAAAGATDTPEIPENEVTSNESQREQFEQAAARFALELPGGTETADHGYLVINPSNIARRVFLELPELSRLPQPDREKAIYAAAETGEKKAVVVDVPQMGFAWVADQPTPRKRKKPQPILVDDRRKRDNLLLLRNEYLEILISPETGGIQSLKDYGSRTGRIAQQLAVRSPGRQTSQASSWDANVDGIYSRMQAESIEVLAASNVEGIVQSKGKLVDQNSEPLAEFQQTIRVTLGSRIAEVDVQLQPLVQLGSDPWTSYVASRFAWSDESASVYRAANEVRYRSEAKRFEAPLYLEIESGEARTAILTRGLPFHRRVDFRMLDTILLVRGETAESFQFGIGVDLANPLHDARHLLVPPLVVSDCPTAPEPPHAWLFHLDAKSLVVTSWQPILENGKLAGVTVRLLESAGRATRARFNSFRPFVAARRLDFRGQSLGECQLDQGQALVELAMHEWSTFELRWEPEAV